MRYFMGFVFFLLALGTLRVVGCGDEGPECLGDEDCPDGVCASGICVQCLGDQECDDQNECTTNYCFEQSCHSEPVGVHLIPSPCDFDGVQGIAGEDGICSEEGVCVPSPCDDGNECTDDAGPHDNDGACFHYPCDGCGPCDWNGGPGVCIEGVCEEDPCHDVVCDDGDLCTNEQCDYRDGTCHFYPRCRSNPCRVASCDPADGSCDYRAVNDGGSCNAYCILGNPECSGGECVCAIHWGAFEVQQ